MQTYNDTKPKKVFDLRLRCEVQVLGAELRKIFIDGIVFSPNGELVINTTNPQKLTNNICENGCGERVLKLDIFARHRFIFKLEETRMETCHVSCPKGLKCTHGEVHYIAKMRLDRVLKGVFDFLSEEEIKSNVYKLKNVSRQDITEYVDITNDYLHGGKETEKVSGTSALKKSTEKGLMFV